MYAEVTRYERSLTESRTPLGPVVGAAAMRARRSFSVHEAPQQLGATMLGGIVLPYVLWVREMIERLQIRDVAFLARDAELFLDAANAMPADHWSGIELSYLHANRRSWALAAAPIVGVDQWIAIGTLDRHAYLLHSAMSVPFDATLGRVGLTIADLSHEPSLADADPLHSLDEVGLDVWRDLLQSGRLDDLILERARPSCELVLDRLRATLGSRRLALVDVGWRGQQAWLISSLVEAATGQVPVHLHFGGDGVKSDLDSRVDIRRFALDDSLRPHPVSNPISYMETFLGSGKPRLIGYRRSLKGEVEEVFEADVDNAGEGRELRDKIMDGAIRTASECPPRDALRPDLNHAKALADPVRSIMADFWHRPLRHEAELVEGLRFESDDLGMQLSHFVHRYQLSDVIGGRSLTREWRDGSLAITPQPLRQCLATYFQLRTSS